MVISSRTPEGEDNCCPVCGNPFRLEPSRPPGDAPCPCCGVLVWFATPEPGPSPAALPDHDRFKAGRMRHRIRAGLRRAGRAVRGGV